MKYATNELQTIKLHLPICRQESESTPLEPSIKGVFDLTFVG